MNALLTMAIVSRSVSTLLEHSIVTVMLAMNSTVMGTTVMVRISYEYACKCIDS